MPTVKTIFTSDTQKMRTPAHKRAMSNQAHKDKRTDAKTSVKPSNKHRGRERERERARVKKIKTASKNEYK